VIDGTVKGGNDTMLVCIDPEEVSTGDRLYTRD
jgi:hypothetical protein